MIEIKYIYFWNYMKMNGDIQAFPKLFIFCSHSSLRHEHAQCICLLKGYQQIWNTSNCNPEPDALPFLWWTIFLVTFKISSLDWEFHRFCNYLGLQIYFYWKILYFPIVSLFPKTKCNIISLSTNCLPLFHTILIIEIRKTLTVHALWNAV